jgi:hypothetical protein
MNMAQDASKDKFTLEALKVAIDLGDPTAKLIFEDLMKEALRKIYGSGSAGRYGEEGGGRLKDPLAVEGALEKFRNDPDLRAKLNVIERFYSLLLSCGLEKTDVMVYQEFFDKIAKTINSTEILGEKVGELGQECDSSTKSLSSFSKFLAEGKLGDLAHLDTSKQNAVFEAPSAELEDYEIDYPEKAPEAVKKVPFFSGYSYALPDEYNKQYTSKQNEMSEAPSAELDKYEIDYPEKAPGSGFFGGLKESFMSETKKLLDSFGIGGGKGLLGNLFGGIDKFIKNINTHLFLFIKHNNLLQQRNYEKGTTRFVPIRMWQCYLTI